jgi:predicted HTH transcriptional regulator
MNQQALERLLAQDESASLEFKEKIDLESKEGKAKFLKEMLALANSAVDLAYLIIGVEDKTKKLVGVNGITDEQLQQVVADNCRPPIVFSYSVLKHKGIPLGIVRIPHSQLRPHTVKKKFEYLDSSTKKQESILETQVFVRRGSKIDVATPEEIIAMAQDRESDAEFKARVSGHLKETDTKLEETNSALVDIAYTLRNSKLDQSEEPPDRLIEGTSIGIITGLLVGGLWAGGWLFAPLISPIVGVMVGVILSSLRIVKYGLFRSIIMGLFIGAVLTAIFKLALASLAG